MGRGWGKKSSPTDLLYKNIFKEVFQANMRKRGKGEKEGTNRKQMAK